jgi:cytochrome P450
MGTAPHPARPPWSDFGRLWRLFGRDVPAGLMYVHSKYGPFVRTRLPLHIYFVADPDAIEEILVKKPEAFRKDRTSRLLSRVIGNGLLVNEGESWRRQRRLLQPAFHQRHLQTYAALMVRAVERAAAGWHAGEVHNVHQEMMGVTMTIVAEALFGTELSADADRAGHAISDLMESFSQIVGLAARYQPPAWIPTPRNLRFKKAGREIDGLILRIIASRKQAGQEGRQEGREDRDDLLSLLVRARDEDGGGMSDRQVRDEAMTLFLAGHETTALALTYALHLLARHPERQAQVAGEVARVLGGRAATFEDLPALAFTEAVVLETMRLYPPAWAFGRQALDRVEIAGFQFPRGAEFVISPYVVHRDPRWFPDPETFDPDRWRDDLARRLPRFAYLPFGGGPRICIGNRFAMMEAKLVLASLIQRFRFEPVTGADVVVQASVTLRPRDGVRLRLSAA